MWEGGDKNWGGESGRWGGNRVLNKVALKILSIMKCGEGKMKIGKGDQEGEGGEWRNANIYQENL